MNFVGILREIDSPNPSMLVLRNKVKKLIHPYFYD